VSTSVGGGSFLCKLWMLVEVH